MVSIYFLGWATTCMMQVRGTKKKHSPLTCHRQYLGCRHFLIDAQKIYLFKNCFEIYILWLEYYHYITILYFITNKYKEKLNMKKSFRVVTGLVIFLCPSVSFFCYRLIQTGHRVFPFHDVIGQGQRKCVPHSHVILRRYLGCYTHTCDYYFFQYLILEVDN